MLQEYIGQNTTPLYLPLTERKIVAETREPHKNAAVSLKKRIKLPSRSCAVVDVDINTSSTDKVQLIPDEYCLAINPNMCHRT